MKVLVTGHKGYIGTVLVRLLLERGHEPIGMDSDLFEQCTFGEGLDEIPEMIKDIRDAVLSDFDGVEAVVHLAGLSNDPLGDLNPELTAEINHRASVRLAVLAKEAGVKRFVFSSSCSNYGAAGDDLIDENGEFNPVTPYGQSKVWVEKDVSRLADRQFCPTFLRNATAYGVSARLRFDLVLNNLVAWAFTTGQVYLKSDGSPWRPIVHIEDISRAFIAVLEAPEERVHDQAFNIGRTDQNFRIRELAEVVKNTVPNCRVEYAPGAAPDKRNYRVNCDKALRTLPGFTPKWDASAGARELYEAYQRIGIKLEDFEGPKYKRIDHIKMLIRDGRLDERLRWTDVKAASNTLNTANDEP